MYPCDSFFLLTTAAPYCNPPMQQILKVVANTWAFEEDLFLTDQKGKIKLHLFTFSMSLRQSASSGTAGCGKSPSLVLINITLLG